MALPNRPRTSLLATLAVASLVLLATACGSTDGTDDGTGSGTTVGSGDDTTGAAVIGAWTLTGYLADGTETPAATPPANLTISDDGTFSGHTGCNGFSGTWTGDADGAFTIAPGPMTQMACVDPAGQAQETAITTGFSKVTDATVSGTTLTFQDSAGAALFTWTEAPQDLVGDWDVTGVNDGAEAVTSSAATEDASITFAADGTVSGTTGCNSFSGTYEVDGSSLSVAGDLAQTMMACEGEAQELEDQLMAALAAVSAWERSGDQVTLRDPSGTTQITLSAS